MLKFDLCNITHDGKSLNIGVHVENLSYYANIYIDKIQIDDVNTYKVSGPSDTPVFSQTIDGNLKSVSLQIDSSKIGQGGLLNDNLYFVWVTTKGTVTGTPPYDDSQMLLCIAFNEMVIMTVGMYYIGELREKGKIPDEFLSWILDCKALELSIKTGNYSDTVEIWNRMSSVQNNIIPELNPGCYD